MNKKSLSMLEKVFKKYYFDNFDLLHVPDTPKEREFAYRKFDSKLYRHISLKSDKELHLLLITKTPSDIYCSNACYSFPTLPMDEKNWKKADLIFDIDSKDLQLRCRESHTCIKCINCNTISTKKSNCSKCNSNNVKSISVLCNYCIAAAKKEVKKLLTILIDNLGIETQHIFVYFSGNDGFHIYINNSQYQTLGSHERTDIVDYIMPRYILTEINNNMEFKKSDRINQNYQNIVFNKDQSSYKNNFMVYSKSNTHIRLSRTIIDPSVTVDIHRVFRLAGSINSKSGMSKILCKDLDEFDPMHDACLIDNLPTEILANCPIRFTLKNKKFGPFENERINVPKYAAVYMICKGLAEIYN